MSSYLSMKEKLLPLGLYSLEEGSEVDCEVKAYASELEDIFTELTIFEREMFISSAALYGLDEREKMYGKVRDDLDLQERRELLEMREEMNFDVLTLDRFGEVLESWGVTDYTLTESLTRARLTVRISDDLDDTQKRMIEERAQIEIPAHAEVNIIYDS